MFYKSNMFGYKYILTLYESRLLQFKCKPQCLYKVWLPGHHLTTQKSRLTIVSREAKKKQAVRDEQVSYLHVAPL